MRLVLSALLASSFATAAFADPAIAPTLGAASNFGQGWQPRMLQAALDAGIRDFRDAVYWDRVERAPGEYVFDTQETLWPDRLPAAGAGTSLTVNNGHSAHDGGATPHSPAAVEAFAAHAAATALRFPAIHSVEVGNEFNSANFVSGPVKDGSLQERAEAYVALLRATEAAVRTERPNVRILGGGVHSIPAGYLAMVADLGGADLMDALVVHPYSTPPEQFARQVGVLRWQPAWSDMPLEVTEFGDTNPETAPGYLLRYYCQMAVSGVERVIWYALNDRGDGHVPLISPRGKVTETGRTWQQIARRMAGREVVAFEPDPYTYGCRFGDEVLVIWGAPRRVSASDSVAFLGPAGDPEEGPHTLSATDPLVLVATEGSVLADPQFAPQPLLADSFHDYRYPHEGDPHPDADPFRRYVLRGREVPLLTRPGQERGGVPWVPYRAAADDPMVRLTAETLLPGGTGERPAEIVHLWEAGLDRVIDLGIDLSPAARSDDGVTLRVALNGQLLHEQIVAEPLEWRLDGLAVKDGDRLEIAVGPNRTATGDVTQYRFRIWRAGEQADR
ncbi:hypothetical protein CLV78_102334 [Aliiruegeria haliotis]|uniref:Glycosyl hydrolase n=1 Tax=Aliiruegeria haliotis TaxID=1280846 RepID=A0A2T0RVH6_9RHOB|nr:hypothetical protein [Aliiruegeria haliotis]PRY25157.1 hypothetical protein CLV78_102334 [Aliiruegeria haliotis]